ncbi:unnamed protein product, partial [Mesorhabditis spiculigera]
MNFVSGVVDIIKPRIDDSGADRMNYYYTTMIIMGVSVMISARQVATQLIYYQWVPFIMGLEALFFFLPAKVWGLMNRSSGMNIESMVKTAQSADDADTADREKGIAIICLHLEDCIKLQAARREGATFWKHIVKLGKLDGTYLAKWFVVVFFYTLIDTFQLLLKNRLHGSQAKYVRKYLTLRGTDELFVDQFCTTKISTDIMIILRIITNHSSEFVTRDILALLWKDFRKNIHNDTHDSALYDETRSLTKA